jgi:DNA-binding transcriptional regulator LsrR (DeoR family)
MYNAGSTLVVIAEHFGVDRSVVGRIVNRKIWKHI